MKICKNISCREGIYESVTNLGNVFFEKQDYKNATFYFNKSIESAVILGDKMGKTDGRNDLAVIYKKQNQDTKAIACYEKGLKIHKHLSYDLGIAHILCNLAVVNAKTSNFDLAINQYNQSYKALEKLNLTLDMAETFMNIGNLYNVLGDSASVSLDQDYSANLYKTANDYNSRSLALAQALGSVIEIKQSSKDLISEYYKREESEPRAKIHDPINDLPKGLISIKNKGKSLKRDLHPHEIKNAVYED